jgi:hypothetical protein
MRPVLLEQATHESSVDPAYDWQLGKQSNIKQLKKVWKIVWSSRFL